LASEDQTASALFDDAPCALMRTTADGTVLRANRTFYTWLGFSPEALVGRRRFQDLLKMGGRIFHQTHWAPLLQMQNSISEVKLEVVAADGSIVPMMFNAIRRQQDGALVYDLAGFIARDRDKYERELIHSRKRLEDLVAETGRLHAEAKDRALFSEQMIGIVSHDLRNPMSSIHMGAHLLAESELSPNQKRIVTRIQRSTARANHLIADLLDFTQARLGKGLAIAPEEIDLHAAMAETVEELTAVYPARKLQHHEVGEGLCRADASRLEQLVGNLVSNAMVHGSAEKPVTVTSTVRPESFSIAVHNEGTPIPPSLQTVLFQPMTRGMNATSAGRSVGLGLFIVSQIAKAHGGTAFVTSTPTDGTTFTVMLPRV
jgi:sigma-B regulation protein RsbU (phosphoserine phosphatase)